VATPKKDTTVMEQRMLMSMDVKEEFELRRAVLVVDDSDQICRMMKRRLAPFFEKVFTAADPKEATRILYSVRIRLDSPNSLI
jgi:PleD family two-component response regulator